MGTPRCPLVPDKALSAPRVCGRLEHKPGDVAEDAVVGDQRDTKAYRGRRDPAVGVVLTLAEGVADPLALGSEPRISEHQLWPRVDRLGRGDAGFELARPGLAPGASQRTVAELGRRLERDERGPTDDDRLVDCREGRAGDEQRAGRQCRSLWGRGAAGCSRPQGGEEGNAFFDREVLDHHLAGWGQGPGAPEQLGHRQFKALVVVGLEGLGRHLGS